MTYRFYITDSLKCIAENTACMVNGGKYPSTEYRTIVRRQREPEEKRSAEEITMHIKDKLKGLKDG